MEVVEGEVLVSVCERRVDVLVEVDEAVLVFVGRDEERAEFLLREILVDLADLLCVHGPVLVLVEADEVVAVLLVSQLLGRRSKWVT